MSAVVPAVSAAGAACPGLTAALTRTRTGTRTGTRARTRTGTGRTLRRGFTLVEVLVVLAVAGLMLAVTPPMLSGALPGLELKGAARRTASALRLTRELAIAEGRPAAWLLDIEGGTYRIDGRGRDGRLPRGIALELIAAADEMASETQGGIRFFPDGTSTGGRVILKRGEPGRERGYQVGVNWLTGRVLIADWEAQ